MHLIITSIDGSTQTHDGISRQRARQVAAAATRNERTLEVLVFSYAPAWGLIPLAESDALVAAWKRVEGWMTPDANNTRQEQDAVKTNRTKHLSDLAETIINADVVTADMIRALHSKTIWAAREASDLDSLVRVIHTFAMGLDGITLGSIADGAAEDAAYEAKIGIGLEDLPDFGGDPVYAEGVWSWDADRLLVGVGGLADWHIIDRDEWRDC